METEQERLSFRRYFIMIVLKMFLNPTSQQTVSPWHLPPILDVSNPRRFHWPYQILKWLRDAIRKFQDENRETCGGCMFVLLVLYFHRLKHGPLHACRVPEPWIIEWTTNELDKQADHVISQGCIVNNERKQKKRRKQTPNEAVVEKGRSKRPRRDADHSPTSKSRTTSQPIYKESDKEYRTGTRRKVIARKSRSRIGTKKGIPREKNILSNAAPLAVPDSDEDDHMPLARRIRLFQQQPQPRDAEQAEPVCNANPKSPIEENTKHTDKSPHTPQAAHVQLSDYDFDREFDISIIHCPEFEEVLNNVEKGCESKAMVMQPLQTVLPTKSGYHTPSPGRPSFSLGLTQFEKTPTPSPIQSIHPSLKKIKLGEIKEEQIRSWIVDSSLNKKQDLAKYEGREYMVLQRKDFWSLKPRNWVNSFVIQWMCYSFNDIESSRFKRDFYCVSPGILESMTRDEHLASFIDGVRPIYPGLSPSFGEDTRFFDKVVAAKRKWWLFPYCRGGHWWLYAFEVNAKRMAILDSLHSAPVHDERDKLDALVGRLCEDMASIAIPAFVRSTYGPARSYAKVPIQPNNFDCGMCVIKLMERWTEEHELYAWDEDSLRSHRMELMLDIICGQHNALIHQIISLLEEKGKPVRRNAPRNKKKDVSSPYTAPSTRSLIERAEGLPKGELRKGRKKLLT